MYLGPEWLLRTRDARISVPARFEDCGGMYIGPVAVNSIAYRGLNAFCVNSTLSILSVL